MLRTESSKKKPAWHIGLLIASTVITGYIISPYLQSYILKVKDNETFRKANKIQYNKVAIRKWGCNRTETPLIFVHIGKAGGGNIRARISASRLNMTAAKEEGRQGQKWAKRDSGAYYPIRNGKLEDEQKLKKARFANSIHPQYGHVHRHPQYRHVHLKSHDGDDLGAHYPFRNSKSEDDEEPTHPHYIPKLEPHGRPKTFEETLFCNALTPIGQAIACPGPYVSESVGSCDFYSEDCLQVYVGHNMLGSEMHWLPPAYLKKWWKNTVWGADGTDPVTKMWELLSAEKWCLDAKKRGKGVGWPNVWPISQNRKGKKYKKLYSLCSAPLQVKADKNAVEAVSESSTNISWSSVYASLPVLRVTMMRDPFSWLLSKYGWHHIGRVHEVMCDDIEAGIKGWITTHAIKYILQLCGEDCIMRYNKIVSSLEMLERQAEENLRQSFAVVGLLNESDLFYQMLTDRVDYLDTSLNPELIGLTHNSSKDKYCVQTFSNSSFQERLLAASPEVAVLQRLYNVAVEVNRFQLIELESCKA